MTVPAELAQLPPPHRAARRNRTWSLKRITSGSSWIPEIDGLRFIAITLVVLFHLIAEPLLIALAFVAAFRGVLLRRFLATEWLAILGGMCYSIYLWHFFIIALVFKASRRIVVSHDLLISFLLQSVMILPCIFAFCALYFVFIERPCMDPAWPQKLRLALCGHRIRPAIAHRSSN